MVQILSYNIEGPPPEVIPEIKKILNIECTESNDVYRLLFLYKERNKLSKEELEKRILSVKCLTGV